MQLQTIVTAGYSVKALGKNLRATTWVLSHYYDSYPTDETVLVIAGADYLRGSEMGLFTVGHVYSTNPTMDIAGSQHGEHTWGYTIE